MKRTSFLFVAILFLSVLSVKAQDFTYAAEKSIHSVVYIQCQYHQEATYFDDFYNNDFFSQFFSDPFGSFFNQGVPQPRQRTRTYQTSGSGVIISSDGYIVTNNHVVADADSITVTLNDKREFIAKLIGTDPNNDLAVIKISATDLQPLIFANSDEVKVGQWVLAVGNPFNLTSTVTAGIVSAKARDINILSTKGQSSSLTSFIQTDAAMNPGNSGGALVNLQGDLIGINAAIASNGSHTYVGYSFAIPSNIAKKVTDDIIKYGSTQKASAGINTQEITAKLSLEKNLVDNSGIYVASVVKGGAADKAGIKEGDVIKSINNKSVNTVSELNEIMTQLSPKQTVTFTIERSGKKMDKQVTLLDQTQTTQLEESSLGPEVTAYGVSLREINAKEKQEYQISKALVVTKSTKGALASQLKKGFVITAIDGNVNITIKDAQALAKKKGQTTIEGFYPESNRSCYFVLVL